MTAHKLPKKIFAAIIALMSSASSFAMSPEVMTANGPVLGRMKNQVAVFRGIPYAEAPVGELRWHAPLPHANWTNPINALKDGSICLQPKTLGKPDALGSEDCLTLNIWQPTKDVKPKAVMVFIHGGFYIEGSSDADVGNLIHIQGGQGLAEQGDVVVVSFNYRLGVMGFLAHPALNDGTPESQSGNFGLMDQLEALKWVQKNIASFGGDPSKVTVFGQSAGASSVLTLLASPMSEGLFSQAIVESGYLKDIPRTQAFELSQKLVDRSGCGGSAPTAQCLRNLTPAQIIASVPASAREGTNDLFVPNQDGFIIREPLADIYSQGLERKIPLMLGTNSDEASTLASSLYGGKISTEQQLEQTITTSYGAALWGRAKPIYDSSELGDPQTQLIQFATDAVFTCSISTIAKSHAESSKTWRYVFSHTIHLPVVSKLEAFHGAELPFVFGSFPKVFDLLPKEIVLSKVVRSYWSNFAKNGNPNLTGLTDWPAFDQKQLALNITEASDLEVIDHFRQDRCEALGL